MLTRRAPQCAPHRVLLVREWDAQVGGSGCCGRLGSAAFDAICSSDEESPYAHARAGMERAGEVWRLLREELDESEVELTVVDPRNSAWLLPAVWRDGRRHGLSVPRRLRELHRATATGTVVCDGVVVARDAEPETVLAAVREAVAG